jgi:hypothetical protein
VAFARDADALAALPGLADAALAVAAHPARLSARPARVFGEAGLAGRAVAAAGEAAGAPAQLVAAQPVLRATGLELGRADRVDAAVAGVLRVGADVGRRAAAQTRHADLPVLAAVDRSRAVLGIARPGSRAAAPTGVTVDADLGARIATGQTGAALGWRAAVGAPLDGRRAATGGAVVAAGPPVAAGAGRAAGTRRRVADAAAAQVVRSTTRHPVRNAAAPVHALEVQTWATGMTARTRARLVREDAARSVRALLCS